MYFETAGIEVHPLLPPLVALGLSFVTSMGGISGAVLLLPFQVTFLGFTTPAVTATNQLYNVVAIPAGCYVHIRRENLAWPLAKSLIAGTVPGILLGSWLRVAFLPDPLLFKIFAGFVLLVLGLRLALEGRALRKSAVREKQSGPQNPTGAAGPDPPKGASHPNYPAIRLSLIALMVGIVSGIYGVGGGAFMAPILVSFFHLPVQTVAGAALIGTLAGSTTSVAFFQILALSHPETAVSPDWMLGLLFGLGGSAGIYLGGRCQKYVPERLIRWILCLCVLLVSLRYLTELTHLLPRLS